MSFAGSGQRIDLPSPTSGLGPGAPNEASLFKPVEDGVEGAMPKPEQPVAVGLDVETDLVTVFRPRAQSRKDQQLVDVPCERLNIEVLLGHDPVLLRGEITLPIDVRYIDGLNIRGGRPNPKNWYLAVGIWPWFLGFGMGSPGLPLVGRSLTRIIRARPPPPGASRSPRGTHAIRRQTLPAPLRGPLLHRAGHHRLLAQPVHVLRHVPGQALSGSGSFREVLEDIRTPPGPSDGQQDFRRGRRCAGHGFAAVEHDPGILREGSAISARCPATRRQRTSSRSARGATRLAGGGVRPCSISVRSPE